MNLKKTTIISETIFHFYAYQISKHLEGAAISVTAILHVTRGGQRSPYYRYAGWADSCGLVWLSGIGKVNHESPPPRGLESVDWSVTADRPWWLVHLEATGFSFNTADDRRLEAWAGGRAGGDACAVMPQANCANCALWGNDNKKKVVTSPSALFMVQLDGRRTIAVHLKRGEVFIYLSILKNEGCHLQRTAGTPHPHRHCGWRVWGPLSCPMRCLIRKDKRNQQKKQTTTHNSPKPQRSGFNEEQSREKNK